MTRFVGGNADVNSKRKEVKGMTKMKMLVSISVALALLVALVPTVALADTGGESTGSFTVGNSDPTVTAVALWDTEASPAEATSMTPQVEYNVKVDVTDSNTLDDLDTVTVTIFYDADGTYAVEDVPVAGHTQTASILTWTNLETDTWTMDAVSEAGSWSIVSGSCVTPSMTASSDTFEFHFIVGSVATETIAPAKWHIYAEADDGEGGTPGSGTLENLTMDWYGGITVTTVTVDWGSVSPGMDFAEGDPSEEAGISVTYIANGAYDEQVAASGSWTGAPSGTATLNEAGTPGANEFSLKADDTATLGSAVLVTASPTYVTIDDTGIQTEEAGDPVTTNSLWLKLGTPFSGATYSGTIYYQISNG